MKLEIEFKYYASEIETIADRISKYLQPGLLVAFIGVLGAGKTTLIRKILEGQNVAEQTASPTFAYLRRLTRQCDGQVFYHADLYRISSLEGLEDLGIIEALEEENAIALVEWPELILKGMAQRRPILLIKIEHLSEEQRIIKIICNQ
jgi:tRNA threonylcarbamoyl adenosine modification protein YjeE